MKQIKVSEQGEGGRYSRVIWAEFGEKARFLTELGING